MKKSRVYIVPTRLGFYFSAVLLLILVMALIYANNFVFFTVFFLASLGFVTLYQTNANLKKLTVDIEVPKTQFLGEALRVPIRIFSPSIAREVKLICPLASPLRINEVPAQRRFLQSFEIELKSQPDLGRKDRFLTPRRLRWSPLTRGFNTLPWIRLESEFPLGFAKAWTFLPQLKDFRIWPERKNFLSLEAHWQNRALAPKGDSGLRPDDLPSQALGFRDSNEDYSHHQIYQPGQRAQRIDWKASVRKGEILEKVYDSPSGSSAVLKLSWKDTETLVDFEDRISQLTFWISEFSQQGFEVSLDLPFKEPRSLGTNTAELFDALSVLKPGDLKPQGLAR